MARNGPGCFEMIENGLGSSQISRPEMAEMVWEALAMQESGGQK